MGEHRFADALTYAQKALSLGTGDISPCSRLSGMHTRIWVSTTKQASPMAG